MTSDLDRRLLLGIARQAMVAHVTGGSIARDEAGSLANRRGGAFVSLHHQNELRGCIGHIEADRFLLDVVAECAVAACSSDPRFAPITAPELHAITIELSLLGTLEPIATPAEIEIGQHGLVVEKGWQRGLLLPQVATEWKWNREQFLEATCHKAGLARDAWKQGAQLWRFEAEVFAEAVAPGSSQYPTRPT